MNKQDAQRAAEVIDSATAAEYSARLARNEEWAKQYRKPNGWTVITKEEQETCPADARITNAERGKLEQFRVLAAPPERLFAYFRLVDITGEQDSGHDARTVSRGCMVRVSTWTGDLLGFGRVTSYESFRSNFGDRRVNFRCTIGGTKYYGTAYLDAGDYCRLRRAKSR